MMCGLQVIYRDYVEVAREIVAELHQQGTPPAPTPLRAFLAAMKGVGAVTEVINACDVTIGDVS